MKHYICEGDCGGVSDTPKACGTQGCSMEGKDLKECECTDGKHSKNQNEE